MPTYVKEPPQSNSPPPKPSDLIDSIRQRLAAKDFGDQTTLLCLGIHLLRQRQLDQQRAGR